MKFFATLTLCLVAPLAAITSAFWLLAVGEMAWKHSLGTSKDAPFVFLVFLLSIFLLRWSVSLSRFVRTSTRA